MKTARIVDNTNACRAQCKADVYITDGNRSHAITYISAIGKYQNDRNADAFLKIANNLQKIIERGDEVLTCHLCSKIGDSIIATQVPKGMQIEHLDVSFNLLCELINQPHQLHKSQQAYFRDKGAPGIQTEQNSDN